MGNRAIITTQERKLGLYLHWNGGVCSVEAFLAYCRLKRYRSPADDYEYAFARLAQVVGNFFGGTTSVGAMAYVCDEQALYTASDNGIYVVGDWKIEEHLVPYADYASEGSAGLADMLRAIDAAQPPAEQLGPFLNAREVPRSTLKPGDQVWVYDEFRKVGGRNLGGYTVANVQGLGRGRAGGQDVSGVPYADLYCDACGDASRNINNYLLEDTYRLVE